MRPTDGMRSYRRTLALADVASAGIAVLIGVPILGEDALNPVALLALPLVLVVGKLTGLYDRDEHLIRKTTLDEVPALFWVATLYALLIWLGGDLIVDGHFGRDQAVGVWALLFASMVAIRALARRLAGALSGEERCLVLGDAETADWITRRFDEAPGLKARVVGRCRFAPEPAARTATPSLHGRDLEGLLDRTSEIETGDHRAARRRLRRPPEHDPAPEVDGAESERAAAAARGRGLLGRARRRRRDHPAGDAPLRPQPLLQGASSAASTSLGAGLGLLVLSPLLAAIAIAIKLDSRGPVLFRQRRMGRNGVPFEMLKFRTMVDGRRRAASPRSRRATRRRAACSRSRTIRGSPGSAVACGGPRSTSCPSCSTCCAATCPSSAPGRWCSTRTAGSRAGGVRGSSSRPG